MVGGRWGAHATIPPIGPHHPSPRRKPPPTLQRQPGQLRKRGTEVANQRREMPRVRSSAGRSRGRYASGGWNPRKPAWNGAFSSPPKRLRARGPTELRNRGTPSPKTPATV